MSIKRALNQPHWLRVALPTLIVAGLGATAIYLGAPPTSATTADAAAESSEAAEASDCPLVNGFTVTITSGSPSCEEINTAAQPYTAAVLADEPLGSSLMWSDKNWQCSRNYDATGQIWNAHGLVCEGTKGTFVLVSD